MKNKILEDLVFETHALDKFNNLLDCIKSNKATYNLEYDTALSITFGWSKSGHLLLGTSIYANGTPVYAKSIDELVNLCSDSHLSSITLLWIELSRITPIEYGLMFHGSLTDMSCDSPVNKETVSSFSIGVKSMFYINEDYMRTGKMVRITNSNHFDKMMYDNPYLHITNTVVNRKINVSGEVSYILDDIYNLQCLIGKPILMLIKRYQVYCRTNGFNCYSGDLSWECRLAAFVSLELANAMDTVNCFDSKMSKYNTHKSLMDTVKIEDINKLLSKQNSLLNFKSDIMRQLSKSGHNEGFVIRTPSYSFKLTL